MKTLLEYYNEIKNHKLKNQLLQNKKTNCIITEMQNEINNLRNINAEYIQQLTPLQARIAIKGLADINRTLDLVKAVTPLDAPTVLDIQDSVKLISNKSNKKFIYLAVISGGAGGIFGNFVSYLLINTSASNIPPQLIKNISNIIEKYPTIENSIKNYPDFQKNILDLREYKYQVEQLSNINQFNPAIPISIGFLTSMVIAGIIAILLFKRYQQQPQPQRKINLIPPQVNQEKVNEDLLDFLHDKFEYLDQEVAKESNKEKPKPPTPKLEDHPDILKFIQNLLGQVSNEQSDVQLLTNKLNQQIPDILYAHGIQVEFYQPGIEDTSKFDFVTNIDPEVREYVNLTPALIKENKVIQRGRVVKPASF